MLLLADDFLKTTTPSKSDFMKNRMTTDNAFIPHSLTSDSLPCGPGSIPLYCCSGSDSIIIMSIDSFIDRTKKTGGCAEIAGK